MDTLTLNDGTVVNGHILDNGDGRLIFVYLDGISLAEGFRLFSDPEKTRLIIADSSGNRHVFEGYTQMTAINTEFGNCNITMQRG